MTIALTGAPGATVEVIVDGAQRAEHRARRRRPRHGDAGVHGSEFSSSAMRFNYALGDWDGESTAEYAPAVWDARH